MNQPRRKQVRDETFKLLTQEGLEGWRVRFNPRLTRALGRCIASTKTIEYQPRYMEQNTMENVLQTIRHEVAHAVAGARNGHNAIWAAHARRLGVTNPSATAEGVTLTKRFTGTCPTCKRTIERDRRKDISCGKCSRVYDPKHKMIWTRND